MEPDSKRQRGYGDGTQDSATSARGRRPNPHHRAARRLLLARRSEVAELQAAEGGDYEPGETLEEAESEIGVADWIDPDTGEPAEESVPRIEDH